MRASMQRGCLPLVAIVLAGALIVCALGSLGVAARVVTPPPVLASNQVFWLGDRCRADENYLRQHGCLPGYTVDLVLYGDQMRHYTMLHIPALKEDERHS